MKTKMIDNLTKVINASGRMTKLGVSTQSEFVKKNMSYASDNYFDMDELYEVAGSEIASIIGAQDAVVVNSASAGIVLTVASLVAQDNHKYIEFLPSYLNEIEKREIIIPKGHVINYGAHIETMIRLGGGKLVESGSANRVTKTDIESNINENTVAIFYVKSHHTVQKNMVSIEDLIYLSNKYKVPLVIDAAAEEDLRRYYDLGVDLIIYSGSKALEGPASGFVLCKDKKLASNIRRQYYGIGRCMKIGKENIFGLVAAVEEYYHKKKKETVSFNDLEKFCNSLAEIKGVSSNIIQDEAGREIYRCKIHIDENDFGNNAKEVEEKLMSGSPAIYCRDHDANLGNLSFDPRPLTSKEELQIIHERLKEIGEENEN